MLYESTRGGMSDVLSHEAIKMGIAPDGGLFVPSSRVMLELDEIKQMINMSYRERAYFILERFLDDYSEDELRSCIENAYSENKFSSPSIAPVVSLNGNMNILELWHGPTCAFKDMALQILPHFLVEAVKKTGEKDQIVILVATSGDTGKAALEGFKDVEGTKIIVFYPSEGVSNIQKLQMVTQEGNNTYSIGVEGNFDDAQNGVKAIFTDDEIKEVIKQNGYKFSSANSINWGRLVPQIVYYFSAYCDMILKGKIVAGDKINFVVPTGNFGNILAGFYAKKMGLPINKLVCASNDNNVLTDFINNGEYDRRREFIKTVSPSMDILISSNLERLLFEIACRDSERINKWMQELKENGFYKVDKIVLSAIQEIFWADYTTTEETLNTIKCVYNDYNYLLDTHTAVAVDVYDKYVISTGDITPTIIVSTASPFKFNESVSNAVLESTNLEDKNEFELLEILSKHTGWKIPKGLQDLDKKEIRHKKKCNKQDMKQTVQDILNV